MAENTNPLAYVKSSHWIIITKNVKINVKCSGFECRHCNCVLLEKYINSVFTAVDSRKIKLFCPFENRLNTPLQREPKSPQVHAVNQNKVHDIL